MGEEFAGEAAEADVGGGENEEQRQHEQVHQIDDREGEEGAAVGEVGLAAGDHGEGEGGVEGPGETEQSVKNPGGQLGVGLQVEEQGNQSVEKDDADAVDGDEIGGECDPRIDLGGHDVAPVAADAEVGDTAAHQFHHDGVGQFVTVDVDDERFGKPEVNDEPADQPEGKEPELGGGPEVGASGSLRGEGVEERAEKRGGQDVAEREEKKPDDKFHPAHRHDERGFGGGGERGVETLALRGNFAAAVALGHRVGRRQARPM